MTWGRRGFQATVTTASRGPLQRSTHRPVPTSYKYIACAQQGHVGCAGAQWVWSFARAWAIVGACGATQRSTAQRSTAQHIVAQHSAAQHSTSQHSTSQHSGVRVSGVRVWGGWGATHPVLGPRRHEPQARGKRHAHRLRPTHVALEGPHRRRGPQVPQLHNALLGRRHEHVQRCKAQGGHGAGGGQGHGVRRPARHVPNDAGGAAYPRRTGREECGWGGEECGITSTTPAEYATPRQAQVHPGRVRQRYRRQSGRTSGCVGLASLGEGWVEAGRRHHRRAEPTAPQARPRTHSHVKGTHAAVTGRQQHQRGQARVEAGHGQDGLAAQVRAQRLLVPRLVLQAGAVQRPGCAAQG
jgi:hypothetical protein